VGCPVGVVRGCKRSTKEKPPVFATGVKKIASARFSEDFCDWRLLNISIIDLMCFLNCLGTVCHVIKEYV
jgi:hypothetical protein